MVEFQAILDKTAIGSTERQNWHLFSSTTKLTLVQLNDKTEAWAIKVNSLQRKTPNTEPEAKPWVVALDHEARP